MELQQRVQAHLDAHDAVITAPEAARLGVSPNALRSLVGAGLLRRAVRGGYVSHAVEQALGTAERHALLVRAILRAGPAHLAASHQSAAVVYGLPVLAEHLDRAHVANLRETKEARRHDTHSVHRWPGPDSVREHDGMQVVVPELAVLGTAVLAGPRSGIMVADAALRAELTTKTALSTWLERLRHTPGLSAARMVVQRASGTAESGGESLGRLVLEDLGYRVIPQYRIVEEGGLVIARADFFLPDLGVVVEFDGKVKYAGADGASSLAAEKRREDRIRRLGYGVARLIWSDLFHPQRVRAAVEAAARTVALDTA